MALPPAFVLSLSIYCMALPRCLSSLSISLCLYIYRQILLPCAIGDPPNGLQENSCPCVILGTYLHILFFILVCIWFCKCYTMYCGTGYIVVVVYASGSVCQAGKFGSMSSRSYFLAAVPANLGDGSSERGARACSAHWDPDAPSSVGIGHDDGSFAHWDLRRGTSERFELYAAAPLDSAEAAGDPAAVRDPWPLWSFVPGASALVFCHARSAQLLCAPLPRASRSAPATAGTNAASPVSVCAELEEGESISSDPHTRGWRTISALATSNADATGGIHTATGKVTHALFSRHFSHCPCPSLHCSDACFWSSDKQARRRALPPSLRTSQSDCSTVQLPSGRGARTGEAQTDVRLVLPATIAPTAAP